MSIEALVGWAVAGGAYLDPIEIRIGADGNRSVFARRAVAAGELLVAVPRSLMLGASVIAASPAVAAMRDVAGVLQSRYMPLAFWLATERHRRTTSWAPLLDALPADFPPWTLQRRADLRGTRAGELVEERARSLAEDHALLVDLLGEHATPPLRDLDWGLRVARSRCFEVGGAGAHALVPLADMIDHAPIGDAGWAYRAEERRFLITATRALAAGEEIRHRYGAHSNAGWLAGYDFVVEDNPDDEVSVRFTAGGAPVRIGTRVDARFRRAMRAASVVAGGGNVHAALEVLGAAAQRALDELAGLEAIRTEDPSWARTCATIRAGERAVLAHIVAFASRATELLVRPVAEQRAIAESLAADAVGAERLLRGFVLAAR